MGVRLPCRVLASSAAVASAAVHLDLWVGGVRSVHLIGPLFLVNVAAGAIIAVLLLAWRHWLPLLLVIGFGAATLGGFTISATVGLFGLHEHWSGALVWTAATAEVVAIVAGVAGLWLEGHLSRIPPRRRTA